MQSKERRTVWSIALLLGGALAGCQAPTDPVAHQHTAALGRVGVGALDQSVEREVRRATARFSATTQASQAGYVEASPCVSSPPGGMGFHWVNPGLVDPVLDPQRPEALLYAPRANGSLELVGVEYIVLDIGQGTPVLGGQPMSVGGAPLPVPHWTLHAWLFRENPDGVFAPFNPAVRCP